MLFLKTASSMMTFEGQQFQGPEAIIQKLIVSGKILMALLFEMLQCYT